MFIDPAVVWPPQNFVGPSTQRKLAILSDMRAPMEAAVFDPAVRGAAVLIHESTNACTSDDRIKGVTSPPVLPAPRPP